MADYITDIIDRYETNLREVKQYGRWNLRFIQEQTPEVCLAAVQQSGWALQFVKVQTPELCLVAIKHD